jgi:hypothetical protein
MKGFTFFTGDWHEDEVTHTGRYEMNFRVKPANGTGTFEYMPYFFKRGKYNVYMWYPSDQEYESKVPVEIHHSNGIDKLNIQPTKRWWKMEQNRNL